MKLRILLLVAALGGCRDTRPESPGGRFAFPALRRVETPPGSGTFAPSVETLRWEAARTAVIVCDMWDADWCAEATRHMGRLVPRVDAFVRAARRRGAFVIHAPSGTMAFYADAPQRRRALETPAATPPEPIRTHRVDASREGPFPIDDTKSICPCEPRCAVRRQAHTRQNEGIEIAEADAIIDTGRELYNLLRARGIRHVLFTGVHNNLCVLVRSFGIRQLRRLGVEVVLVRDLTIAMYDPRQRPFVTLERATDLVNEHIERYWCPTALAAEFER